jgi:NADPH-dependent ferric siderophore reductase
MSDYPNKKSHTIERVTWDTRRRWLDVIEVSFITPRMLRICFESPGLHDFMSISPDDHIKLYLPIQGHGDEKCRRDYTVRNYDRNTGILTIDFALHDAGPATEWALQARPGDILEISGPKKSMVVADDFDWYLLVGDETALPAIGRRVESLRQGVDVTTIVLVTDESDHQTFATDAKWTQKWVYRNDPLPGDADLLCQALGEMGLPPGEGYVWMAAEAQVIGTLRKFMVEDLKHPETWLKASNYWRRTAASTGRSREGD